MAKKKKKTQSKTRRPATGSLRLSLCMIARDEGAFLDRCLASVKGLVDEIVVVDTGSQDDTKSVARRHGARLFTHPWSGDFSAARNAAVERARGQWILILDCDEVLAPADHDALRQTLNAEAVDAFRLTTRNYAKDAGRAEWRASERTDYAAEEKDYAGWFPTTKVRLWRRHAAVRFEGAVHELVEPSLRAAGQRVADCAVPVHHYGYVEKERATDRYLEAGERKVAAAPKDLQARYELAIAYRDAGRLREGLDQISLVSDALKTAAPRGDYLDIDNVDLVLGDLLDRLDRLPEALVAVQRVVERTPTSSAAHNNIGSLLTRLGRHEDALAAYRRAHELAPGHEVIAANLESLKRHLAARPLAMSGLPGATTAATGEQIAPVRDGGPGQAAPLLSPVDHTIDPSTDHSPDHSTGAYRLSLCIIARNCAADLARCLDSVAAVVDEIVVVDTGSTDDTVAVAQRFGATIGHFPWCDDFAAARNESLRLARTGDWILWLDADDFLLPEDREKIARAKQLTPDQALQFTLVNTEGVDTSSFRQIKMFPRRDDIRFERPVHETVQPSLKRLGWPLRLTDVRVMHTGYADPATVDGKSAYYRRLMEAWLADHPEDLDVCFRLGHTAYVDGKRPAAIAYFDRILESPQRVEPRSLERHAAAFRGRCHLEAGDGATAICDFERALAIDPKDMFAHASIGDALTKAGEYGRARDHLLKALEAEPDGSFPFDTVLIEYGVRFFLGQCLAALGDHEGAVASIEVAVRLQPGRPEAAAALRELRPSLAGQPLLQPPDPGYAGGQASTAPAAVSGSSTGEDQPASRLTLCMIVRNEAHRLGTCLDSVAGLVDEIVIVDTGSTDQTVDIARQYGAVMGQFEWCDDFSAARNESLRLATGDWIMWLDADDILPAEYHGPIRELVKGPRDRSYFFVLDDQGYESVSCLQLRLFPRVEGACFEMPIHEQVTPSLGRLGIDMQPTDIRVVHTGYTTPEVVREKKQRYLGIMERWIETHPGDYIVRSHICLTYHTTGRFEEAVEGYRYIIEQTDCLADHNYVVYTTCLLFLGRTYLKMDRTAEALEWITKAYEFDKDYILSRFSMAEAHLAAGNWEPAVASARSVLASDIQLTFFPVDRRELTYSSLCILGRALAELGDLTESVDALRRAAQVGVQRRSEALGILSEIYKAKGQRDEAYAVLTEALEMSPEDPKHRFNRGMLDLEANQLEAAKAAFSSVLEVSPDYPPALMNLGFIAKSAGDLEEAEGWYAKVLVADPDNVDGLANLAHLYLGQDRFAEAEAYFDRVQTHKPDLLDIQLGLLQARLAQGRWDPLLARMAVSNSPESSAADLTSASTAAAALLQLGVALVHRKILSCAQLAFASAVVAAQGDPAGIRTVLQARRCLGELFMTLGQPWKAVAEYEALLQANPQDAEAFRRLGDSYTRLGVADAARMCYERSRQLTEPSG